VVKICSDLQVLQGGADGRRLHGAARQPARQRLRIFIPKIVSIESDVPQDPFLHIQKNLQLSASVHLPGLAEPVCGGGPVVPAPLIIALRLKGPDLRKLPLGEAVGLQSVLLEQEVAQGGKKRLGGDVSGNIRAHIGHPASDRLDPLPLQFIPGYRQRLSHHLQVGVIQDVADYALNLLDVDRDGLDRNDRVILTTIVDKFDGGPVGIETLAASIGEDSGTLEDVYEPYLIQNGYINRTPRGRVATKAAYDNLGRPFKQK